MTATDTSPVGRSALERFSETLYCSGAVEQRCVLPDGAHADPGTCFWERPTGSREAAPRWLPVVPASLTSPEGAQFDRWNPPAASLSRFASYEAVASCLSRSRHWFFAGDSTVRDLFYEFLNLAGTPVNDQARHWPDDQWEPDSPFRTFARDNIGHKWVPCNGFGRSPCERHTKLGRLPATATFHFIRTQRDWHNLTARLGQAAVGSGHAAPSVVVAQCPLWEVVMPQAYDSTASAEQRHAVATSERAWDDIGRVFRDGCGRFFKSASAAWPGARQYVLGDYVANPADGQPLATLTGQKHQALGLSCVRLNDGTYKVQHKLQGAGPRGPVPVDRFNIVGRHRRSDHVHPHFNAQYAIMQLLLNLECAGLAP